ncbi:Flp pilus assembly protein CpaB [Azonexus sp.]|uniref:Flp pilus assembly protein CpaB n=1 Tax=Azonexus sp. TaxID=1872668 RepID=UPI0039E684C7
MGKTQRVLGILLVLVAIGLAAYAWTVSKQMMPEAPKTYAVVVAAARIEADTLLTAENLRIMNFPERPSGSFDSITPLVGTVTPVDIAAGETVLSERITPPVTQASMQALKPGERAVAIRVDEVIAVGNRIRPGDRVDVFAIFRRNSDEITDSHARLLLPGLRVVAFGSQETAESSKKGASKVDTARTAVLAMPVADVEKLALAAEAGRLMLALHPQQKAAQTDEIVPEAPVLTPFRLKDLTLTSAATPARPTSASVPGTKQAGTTVRVWHGLKETAVHFQGAK